QLLQSASTSNCAPGNYFSGTLGPVEIKHAATQIGWTAGVGAETLFGPRWVARAQYRFSDFGYFSRNLNAFSATDTRVCTGCPSASSSPLMVSYQLPAMQHPFRVRHRIQVRTIGVVEPAVSSNVGSLRSAEMSRNEPVGRRRVALAIRFASLRGSGGFRSPSRLKNAVNSAPIHFRYPGSEINHQPLATNDTAD